MNKPSPPPEDDRDALRKQIVGLDDRTLRKSYFPQLQKQIDALKKARAAEEEKSAALQVVINDLEKSRAQAEESERKFRTLADFTNDMEYWIDPQGYVIYISPSCERLTGYRQQDFVENPGLFTSIVHPDDRHLFAIHAQGKALTGRHSVDVRFVTRSGKIKWIAHNCQAITADDGHRLGRRGSNSDITERKMAEAKIQRLSNLYAALSQCNQAIVRCTNENELFAEICRDAVHFGGLKMAWIGVLNAAGTQIECVASYGDETGYLDNLRASQRDDTLVGKGSSAIAISTNRPIWCQDFLRDPSTVKFRDFARKAGFLSSASLPLHKGGLVVGNLSLYGGSVDMFDNDTRKLLIEMATDISFALDNFERERDRKRAVETARAAEEKFRGLVEQAIAGIYIIQEGRYTYVNPRFAHILGYDSPDDLIGTDPLASVPDKDQLPDSIKRLLQGDASCTDGNDSFTALRKDGTRIEVGFHSARATHAGRPAIIGLLQDISEKRRAEEQIQRYLGQLENAFMHTVLVATNLSELRDPYTAGHEKRVGEIGKAIACEMGLDEHRAKGIEVAGYLHDLGKITIPAEILSKPGKLSAVELLLIQGHALASYNVLKDAEFPWAIAKIALQHHERLDGSGYPQKLKGEEILLDARILAVADVVEAMASHRPYRPGLGLERALSEIQRGSGSIYDPIVVDACLRLFREKGFTIPE